MAMSQANIGLNDATRGQVADILNALLADEYVLYTKTRNFHWNVTGPHFNDLHKFFESQYDELDEIIDDVAERIRMLGERPVASLAGFLKHARLAESPTTLSAGEMITVLLQDHEAMVRQMRADVARTGELGDAGNQDEITGWMESHEKMAWMLRAMA